MARETLFLPLSCWWLTRGGPTECNQDPVWVERGFVQVSSQPSVFRSSARTTTTRRRTSGWANSRRISFDPRQPWSVSSLNLMALLAIHSGSLISLSLTYSRGKKYSDKCKLYSATIPKMTRAPFGPKVCRPLLSPPTQDLEGPIRGFCCSIFFPQMAAN